MLEVGTDRVAGAVEQAGGEVELVEGLVPELSLRPRPEDSAARTWERRGEDERGDCGQRGAGDCLETRLPMS